MSVDGNGRPPSPITRTDYTGRRLTDQEYTEKLEDELRGAYNEASSLSMELDNAESDALMLRILLRQFREEERNPERQAKLTRLDTYELLTTNPPPLDWLADGVFARGYMTLFGGREKGGKSLVQLALAATMVSGGGTVAGITVKPATVLLIDAENGKREIHRRLRNLGLEPAHASNLILVEARGIDLRHDRAQIERLLDRHEPDLLLLDSFRSLWRGSEKDEEEIAGALYPISALAHDRNIGVSLTHHAKKNEDDYRGSTAIGAVPDWVVMLSRNPADPMRAIRRRLSTPYARIAPERPDRWLSIVSEGDDMPVSLSECEAYEPEHEAPVRDEVVAELLDVIRGAGVPSSNGSGTPAPPSWTQAELIRAVGRDPKHRAGRDAVKRLLDLGALYRNGDGRLYAADTLEDA